jgi:hypothetical protein
MWNTKFILKYIKVTAINGGIIFIIYLNTVSFYPVGKRDMPRIYNGQAFIPCLRDWRSYTLIIPSDFVSV